MKSLTNTWPEASALFGNLMGLHDSVIDEISISSDRQNCILMLREVNRYTDDHGFETAYRKFLIEMHGCVFDTSTPLAEYSGYDIIDAELLQHSLWIKSMAGILTFQFKSIRFLDPGS
jgi:hypothetical protein